MAKEKPILRIGDQVTWRGAWGSELPRIVTIDWIHNSIAKHIDKEDMVDSIEFDEYIKQRKFTVGFKEVDNWAYNTQISIPTKNDIECNKLKMNWGNALVDSQISKDKMVIEISNKRVEDYKKEFTTKCKDWML